MCCIDTGIQIFSLRFITHWCGSTKKHFLSSFKIEATQPSAKSFRFEYNQLKTH